MFALFYSLYLAMFTGRWSSFGLTQIKENLQTSVNGIGEFLTSLFNNVDTPMATLGDTLFNGILINGYFTPNYLFIVSFVLALITSIGIVVMAVRGIKRAFSVFFMGIR